MGYISPISLIQQQIDLELEQNILKAVSKYDIHVDREELMRALKYDRDQYYKGYEDAKEHYEMAIDKILNEFTMNIESCSGCPCYEQCIKENKCNTGSNYCINSIKEWSKK